MPADWNPGTQFIQAFSVGSQSAVQGFEAGMRMQQLRSEQAMRQLHERQAAETLSYAMHQHQAAIQQEADTAKANSVFQTLITPTLSMQVPVSGPPTADGQSLGTASVKVANPAYEPDTGKALIRAFSPTIRTPAEAERLVMDAATVNYHLGEAKRQEALSRESQFDPSGKSVILPDGQKVQGVMTSKNTFQPVYSPEITNLTNPETGETTPVIRQGNTTKNIPVDIGARQTNHQILQKALEIDPSKVDVTTDQNGNIIAKVSPEAWKQVSQQGALTTPVRTSLQKQDIETGKVFSLGQQLAPLLTPENVGVRGMATRAFEGVASQILPDFKIGKSSDTVTVAKEYQAALVRGLKSDSNIAESERQTLSSAMPDPASWYKGAPQAKAALATTLEQWGTLSRNNASVRGKPVTSQWMLPEEIHKAFLAGKISETDANALMEGNGWRLIDSLRKSAVR